MHTAFRYVGLTLLVAICAPLSTAQDATEWMVGEAAAVIDLVNEYKNGIVNHAMDSSASPNETCGGESVQGIFLHPLPEGEATWTLSVQLPEPRPGEKLVLLGLVGLRDGIPWDDPSKPKCNGVDFFVRVGQVTTVAATVTGPGWKPISCDLTPFRGQKVELSLVTSSRKNANYDWAVFGRPEILKLMNRHDAWGDELGPNGIRFPKKIDTAGVIVAEVIEANRPCVLQVSREGINLLSGIPVSDGERGWVARRFSTPAGTDKVNVMELAGVPRQCEVYQLVPTIKIEEFKPVTAVPLLGENVFAVKIKNEGPGYYHAGERKLEIHIIDAMSSLGEVKEKIATEGPPDLAPGESVVLRRGPFDIEYDFCPAVRVVLPDLGVSETCLDSFWPPPEQTETILACGDYRISFPKYGSLRAAAIIEHRNPETGKGKRIGTIYPLTKTVYESAAGRHEWPLIRETIDEAGERKIVISESLDNGGRTIKQSLELTSVPEESLLRFTCTLTASGGEFEVYDFSGPCIAFGDRSFGTDHGYALFPGLEYLSPQDHSSSTLDAANPIAQRSAPDPLKITIPLMAVSHEQDVACMFWDPHQEWQSGQRMPGARFNVPPEENMDEYSSMSLYAPPPPEWRPENAHLAAKPILVTPETPLTLSGTIWLGNAESLDKDRSSEPLEGELVFSALKKYFESVGLPEPMRPPRDFETEKKLSREAWLDTIWVPEKKGWRHCVGENWAPAPAPGMATLLLFDKLTTSDPEIRIQLEDRVNEAMRAAVENQGPGYLSSGANCHIMQGEYPFYGGYVQEALEQWMAQGLNVIRQQRDDGTWGWTPGDNPRRQNLGTPGQANSGTCAGPTRFLLRLGRVLGDGRFIEAGLKGLGAMERFRVPRGAQGWECPLHAPDILASAHALRANVEAYHATGDEKYLRQAKYWAYSGLPFIYVWNIDSIPSMRYNTIPIFGATFYTHSWFGRPVVWCGLVYAHALQQLARFDNSFDWERIAKGVTVSAMWQQYEMDHPSKGCYPDSFDLRADKRNPADINPEDIMVNLFLLNDIDPGIKTLKLKCGDRQITVSSGAMLRVLPGEKNAALRLSFFEGETVYTLVRPVETVNQVTIGQRNLQPAENLQEAVEGYQIHDGYDWLIVKTRLEAADETLRIDIGTTGIDSWFPMGIDAPN